jgi:putative hemolysin
MIDCGLSNRSSLLLGLFTALIIFSLVGMQVAGEFDAAREDYQQAKAWCVDHGGEVQPEGRGEVLFAVECELPNGTIVDPYDYVDADAPG